MSDELLEAVLSHEKDIAELNKAVDLLLLHDDELAKIKDALPGIRETVELSLASKISELAAKHAEDAKASLLFKQGIYAKELEGVTRFELLAQAGLIKQEVADAAEKAIASLITSYEQKWEALRPQIVELAKATTDQAAKEYAAKNKKLPELIRKEFAALPSVGEQLVSANKGNWKPEVNYSRGDIIAFRGSSYLVLQTTKKGDFPTQKNQNTPDAVYQLLAACGAPGPRGVDGSGGSGGGVTSIIAGPGISVDQATGNVTVTATGSGSGDVVGPASATDNALARYNLTTGKLIQNSTTTIGDDGNLVSAYAPAAFPVSLSKAYDLTSTAPATDATTVTRGMDIVATVNGAQAFAGVTALSVDARNASSVGGDVEGLSANARLTSSGSTTNIYGVRSINILSGSGNATNAFGFEARAPSLSSTGVITTAYGFLSRARKITGVTTGYGFYQEGASDLNYFQGATTFAAAVTLGALTTNGLVTTSGGTGATSVTVPGTGVLTALGVNVGSAGAFITFNGALGTPSSGTLTNCTGLPTAGLADDAVTNAKLANMAVSTVKARISGGTGDPEDATVAQMKTLLGLAAPSVSVLNWSVVPDTTGEVFFEPLTVLGVNDQFKQMILRLVSAPSTAPTTVIGFSGMFTVPPDYVGTPTITIKWTSSVGSATDARYIFNYRSVAAGGSIDQATYQESPAVTATMSATAFQIVSSTITPAANFAAGDVVEFFFSRDGTAGADTLAGPSLILDLRFNYVTT